MHLPEALAFLRWFDQLNEDPATGKKTFGNEELAEHFIAEGKLSRPSVGMFKHRQKISKDKPELLDEQRVFVIRRNAELDLVNFGGRAPSLGDRGFEVIKVDDNVYEVMSLPAALAYKAQRTAERTLRFARWQKEQLEKHGNAVCSNNSLDISYEGYRSIHDELMEDLDIWADGQARMTMTYGEQYARLEKKYREKLGLPKQPRRRKLIAIAS